MKKHKIWSDIEDIDEFIGDFEEFAEFLDIEREDGEALDEDELRERAYELRYDYLDDERVNLNVALDGDIIILASLGLWNGRPAGYKELHSNNIADCLYANINGCSYCEWYVDSYGRMKGIEAHHDGTNYYEYRKVKAGVSEERLDNALYEYTRGNERPIRTITENIGKYVANVYGWKVRGANKI